MQYMELFETQCTYLSIYNYVSHVVFHHSIRPVA